MLVAVFGDFDAADEFHDKIRPTGFRRPGIEYLGDVGMVHQRQRLPLGLKPGDDTFGVHARLDDFQRDPPADRLPPVRP